MRVNGINKPRHNPDNYTTLTEQLHLILSEYQRAKIASLASHW